MQTELKQCPMKTALNNSFIRVLRDIIPADCRDRTPWTFKAFYSNHCLSDNFLSPNRREFYQIMLITDGTGMLTIGVNTYYIEKPVILFVHPNEIISWKNLSKKSGAHYALFKKAFVTRHPQFKAMLDKFGLFQDKGKSVICLKDTEVHTVSQYFEKMEVEARLSSVYREDIIQALLQLLVVESIKAADFPKPDGISGEYSHIYQFFDLLEKEASGISDTNPIRIRTAKEFANNLHMHPNYLNALLKKQTGQNVSAYIRNRLLEEAKTLLLQTNWNLQHIAYSIGFSEQSNFNFFFKKNTGFTPVEFRRGFN
jgi:AraC-like DNA-binding protein